LAALAVKLKYAGEDDETADLRPQESVTVRVSPLIAPKTGWKRGHGKRIA
jgi:hypothetical protein